MSSACGIRQVESQARAYYVTQFTYKSFKLFDKSGLLCSLVSDYDESLLHYFVLPSEKQNASLALPTSNSS